MPGRGHSGPGSGGLEPAGLEPGESIVASIPVRLAGVSRLADHRPSDAPPVPPISLAAMIGAGGNRRHRRRLDMYRSTREHGLPIGRRDHVVAVTDRGRVLVWTATGARLRAGAFEDAVEPGTITAVGSVGGVRARLSLVLHGDLVVELVPLRRRERDAFTAALNAAIAP